MRLRDRAATFTVVAGRAGSDQIIPDMFAAKAAWDDVIDGEMRTVLTAVLAGVIVPP